MGKMLDPRQVTKLKEDFVASFVEKVLAEFKRTGVRYTEPVVSYYNEGPGVTRVAIENNSGAGSFTMKECFQSDRLKISIVSCRDLEGHYIWDADYYCKPYCEITFTMSI